MIGLAFIVVRGPALAGKTSVARALAARLPGKAALISQDDLLERAIVQHDEDFALETELVYRQIKLLAASYIRAGYHVAVDASFAAYRDGAALHESELRELLGLVSTIANVRPLYVAVTAPLGVLVERSRESERWEQSGVEAMHREFAENASLGAITIDSSLFSVEESVDRILQRLGALA